jgi:elongator complex protein 3
VRVFGFKIHVHFMLNLYGSTCEEDKRDYERLVTEAPYLPDEVKLYPCALVLGTGLCEQYAKGAWRPYSEQELLDVLIADTLATPPFIRISRMVRDISAHDIVVGNKKANLRQLVERRIAEASGTAEAGGGTSTGGAADASKTINETETARIAEIRYREIATNETQIEHLTLETLAYETTVTDEYFLQWVTPEYRIAGFLRLSLPRIDYVRQHQPPLPVHPHEAMIREVHVYGKVAALHERAAGEGAQHLGLGRQLIDAACTLAKVQGYRSINVISSIGTRQYYRDLGFVDNGLYQQRAL